LSDALTKQDLWASFIQGIFQLTGHNEYHRRKRCQLAHPEPALGLGHKMKSPYLILPGIAGQLEAAGRTDGMLYKGVLPMAHLEMALGLGHVFLLGLLRLLL
jgi:hypothetical protein